MLCAKIKHSAWNNEAVHQYLNTAGDIFELFVHQDLLSIRADKPQVSATNLKQHCAIVVTMSLKQWDITFNLLSLSAYQTHSSAATCHSIWRDFWQVMNESMAFGFEPFQALCTSCSINKLDDPCSFRKFPDGPYIQCPNILRVQKEVA